MAFRVPIAQRNTLAAFRDLPADQADAVVDAVSTAPPFTTRSVLATRVNDALGESVLSGGALINALMGARYQLTPHMDSLDSLVQSIAASPGLVTTDAPVAEAFRRRLQALLASEALRTTTMASDLLVQHERPYHSARAFTDIRPIFGEDPADDPSGAIILNVLKLEFWTESGIDELYFALDLPDLQHLKAVVDRALAKTETAKRVLAQAGLTYYEQEEPE